VTRSAHTSATASRRVVIAAVLFLALALGGQAMADAAEPRATGEATTDAVGRASFAYLSGFRTYAAAVLWNRLEPIMHGYFSGVPLKDMRYMVPTINAVVTLDPNFLDGYYVGSWIIATSGHVDEGIALARRGVEANPRSGLLRVAYAQALETWGEDPAAAYEQAVIAMGPETEWRDDFEKHDSYAIMRDIVRLQGDDERVAVIEAELTRIDEELGDALPPSSHDHDGDGVPDH